VSLSSLYATLPRSRIGRLVRARSVQQVNTVCDKFLPAGRGSQEPTVYFDRNGATFNTILDIYRTGLFHLCDSTCAIIRKEDLDFWSIDDLLLGKSSNV